MSCHLKCQINWIAKKKKTLKKLNNSLKLKIKSMKKLKKIFLSSIIAASKQRASNHNLQTYHQIDQSISKTTKSTIICHCCLQLVTKRTIKVPASTYSNPILSLFYWLPHTLQPHQAQTTIHNHRHIPPNKPTNLHNHQSNLMRAVGQS